MHATSQIIISVLIKSKYFHFFFFVKSFFFSKPKNYYYKAHLGCSDMTRETRPRESDMKLFIKRKKKHESFTQLAYIHELLGCVMILSSHTTNIKHLLNSLCIFLNSVVKFQIFINIHGKPINDSSINRCRLC